MLPTRQDLSAPLGMMGCQDPAIPLLFGSPSGLKHTGRHSCSLKGATQLRQAGPQRPLQRDILETGSEWRCTNSAPCRLWPQSSPGVLLDVAVWLSESSTGVPLSGWPWD